jgi:hypothetical protein
MNDTNQPPTMLPSVDASSVSADPAVTQPQHPINPVVAQHPSMQQTIASSLPMEAKDVELIEKAWIEKAKMIVARTHGDPYLQNKALSQVKADYIRKRYGKDIKVSN